MKENKFQSLVIDNLKQLDNIYILNTSLKHTIGIPDLLIGLNGNFIGIELKVSNSNNNIIKSLFLPARKQIIVMEEIERANCKAYGMILFNLNQMVVLFRINFNYFPLEKFYTHINNIKINPLSDKKAYPEFIEFHTFELLDINILRRILND